MGSLGNGRVADSVWRLFSCYEEVTVHFDETCGVLAAIRARAQSRLHGMAATIRKGLRVSAKFVQNGREKLFCGVIVARSTSGWKVRFDDGEERAMQEHLLTPEAERSLTQEMADCLARLRELRGHVTSASVCRAFALDLEQLQMEYFATSARLGRVKGAPAASSPPESPPPISLPEVGEASLPEGVTVGSAVLAPGLHAGQRKPFRALLLSVRNIFPPLLVRYVATLDGKTIPLLLPEIRSTYLPSSDVSKFDEVTMVARLA